MTKEQDDIKNFTMRMPRDIWLFLKQRAMEKDGYMAEIVIEAVEKYREKIEKRKMLMQK